MQGDQEAMVVQGAQEAMAGGLSWPLQPEPFYPPKKNFPGEVRGYQEPSGARQTGHDRTALWGQTDRTRHPSRAKQTGTGHPTGTGSPPGLSSEAEASSGHGMTSGALTGSLSNRFHFHDKGAGG